MRHFSSESEKLKEDVLISPVTTPTSIEDEEKCLVRISYSQPDQLNTKEIWNYCVQNLPYLILSFSAIEAIVFITTDCGQRKILRFQPDHRYQTWRYLTYMLIHEDIIHLSLNLLLQCIFAFFLEKRQGWLRVAVLYLAGGITGVLGASCLNPGVLIGASAGVYSLLVSLIADLYLNFESTSYKAYRIMCIAVIVLSDISFNLYHYLSKEEPLISWEAHIFGGLSGLILGLAVYKNLDGLHQRRRNICFFFSSLIYFLMITSLVIITIDTEASRQVL